MIIDFHTHIFSPKIKKGRQEYVESDPCFAMLYSDKEAKIATAEELIAAMDADGVDISVIQNIGWSTHDLCVETNDYILESVARYPKRLIGFCAIQPLSFDAALAELDRCARGGARGVGEMRPDAQLFDLGDREFMSPFVETMNKHKMVFLTHTSEPVGHRYPGKGNMTPDTIYPFITSFPGLKIACAHWGGGLPFYALMPEVKTAMSNVYFDSAASPYLYSHLVFGVAEQLVGADRILFGSDFPLIGAGRYIKEIRALAMSEDKKDLILAGNARALLGI